jgi:hypothetical protein
MGKSRDRFVFLAESRTKRTVKDIRLIGNLSNRSNYSYEMQDVYKIFRVLDSELKSAKKRFLASSHSSSGIDFKL